jgi:transposase-like protein
MPELELIALAFDRHAIQCPHCHEETIHPWTGKMILFANCKCTHCGRDFVIALNQPRG